MTAANYKCLHGLPKSRGLQLAPLRPSCPPCDVEEWISSEAQKGHLIESMASNDLGKGDGESKAPDARIKPRAHKSHGDRGALAQYEKGKRVMDKGQITQALGVMGSGPVPNIPFSPHA